jgi:xanthomonalisin
MTSQAFDKLRVQVRRANGQVTTLATFSNLQAAPGYSQKTFNLTQFKGQTATFQLVGVEDSGSMTSFLVDDFAIVIES